MGLTVWLAANSLYYPDGGGYLWIYLNWALGLRSLGCHVVWIESVQPETPPNHLETLIASLKNRLRYYGLADDLAFCSSALEALPAGVVSNCLHLENIGEADLMINLSYGACAAAIPRCRRSALIDIDPGLLQIWLSEGNLDLPRHDVYFTIGENIGCEDGRTPAAGLPWRHTTPCVALDWWPVHSASESASFTTISHWQTSGEWVSSGDEVYHNDKRTGFLPFLSLPRLTAQPLELALCLGIDEVEERRHLESCGWRVRNATDVSATPWEFQKYVQQSRGEFSCAKPSYVRMENAWISDRTVCYLASGKPAIVQHTGPSDFLPNDAGLFRFRTIEEAARQLETVASDYDNQCRVARALAEEHFDAAKVVARVIEESLASS